MKEKSIRLYWLLVAIISFSQTFAQHPHSRGGSPLQWALVGGLSAGLIYVFYLLFGLLVKFIRRLKQREFNFPKKLHSLFSKKKDSEEIVSKNEECCENFTGIEEYQKIGNEDYNQGVKPCKKCGKQISDVSLYCNYCGANQNRKHSILRKLKQSLRRFLSFIFILILLAIPGGIVAAIIHEFGGFKELLELDSPDLYCGAWGIHHIKNIVKSYLIFCICAPIVAYILYLLLVYTYKISYKRKNFIIIILALLVFITWGLCIVSSISKRAEAQKIEDLHRVNRSFLDCSFGDNVKKVSNTLKKYTSKDQHPAMVLSDSEIEGIWFEDISYGDYSLDKISFLFYRDKLYKVVMNVQTDKEESFDEPWTYNRLSDMLNKKYLSDDSVQYNNVKKYRDEHTEVCLFHSPRGEDYEVVLTYYDIDSGYIEDQEKGF